MENEEFWSERVEKYGHTGWADAGIYAFDQSLRINVVKFLCEKNNVGNRKMLDFGCGVGDFANAIGKDFQEISIYDPCTDVFNKACELLKYRDKSVSKYNKWDNLKNSKQKFDLILSITVLQHILHDSELSQTLDFLHDSLNENGKFIVMESFFNYGDESYERVWNWNKFYSFVKDSGFSVCEKYNFYHPDYDETFKQYYQNEEVRKLRKQKDAHNAEIQKNWKSWQETIIVILISLFPHLQMMMAVNLLCWGNEGG